MISKLCSSEEENPAWIHSLGTEKEGLHLRKTLPQKGRIYS